MPCDFGSLEYTETSMVLHYELVTVPGSAPTHLIGFFHGILGSGTNLRSHARRLVDACPHLQAVLVDLRAHGQSKSVDGADTLAGAAADVMQTAQAWPLPLSSVVGHSFGGKVALALAAIDPALTHVVTLDSAPGARLDRRGSETVMRVVSLLEGLSGPWPTRDAFVGALETQGLARGLGQWLAMSLVRGTEGFEFGLDLKRIRALLTDYFAADLWPTLELAPHTQFHLVIGSTSEVYGAEDRARAQRLASASGGRVTVDVVTGGHWLHVDNPQAIDALLRRYLGPR